jgi:hypothetical protein
MKRILTLISLIVLFQSTISAQEMNVKGYVLDTSGVTPLKNAVVMAVRLKDSVLLNFTRTNQEGFFELKGFPVDTFSLLVDYPRFEQRNYFILGNKDNSSIEINKVILSTKVKELEEVVIYANKNPIYYNGDTLVYVADSFKVAENAVVEDLLKKLPGITVDKNGKITSQGQDIGKVLVDGDEFFGNDPTIATKNLGAKGIASVQVYEKKEENKEDGTEETIQVLDLKLKENAKNGYFGKATLASDFQQYHEGEFLFNKYKGDQRLSIYALGSSTPRTGIGYADQNKFGVNNFNNNNSTGVPTTFTSGFSFVDKFGKKKQGKISLDYSFNNYELKAATASTSQYILPSDTSYFTNDSTYTKTFRNDHNLNLNIEYKLDSLTDITLTSNLETSNNKNSNLSSADFLSETQQFSRNTSILNDINSNDLSSSSSIDLIRKFMKPRRELGFQYNYMLELKDKIGFLNSSNIFNDSVLYDNLLDQKREESNDRIYQKAFVSFTEPLTKKIKAELNYYYLTDNSNQMVETNDNLNGVYNSLNLLLSNDFKNNKFENKAGFELNYESRKQNFSVGTYLRNINISNVNQTTNSEIKQDISNVLPYANFTYKFSQTSRLRINYNTFSRLPNINDLQQVQNNTNTNRITIGNPDLKPNYVHSVNMFYNTWNALTGRYIWMNFNASITNNDFSSSIVYDEIGRTISQSINVNGNNDLTFRIGGGLPIYKRILSINPRIDIDYSTSNSLINNQKNTLTNKNISGVLELKFQKDSLEFSIGVDQSYFSPSNSLGSINSFPYSNSIYSADFSWKTKFKFKFQTDVNYTLNNQRAAGYNIDIFVWNMSISRNFMETENLVLSLVANDILNQNISAERTVSNNVITDNRTKIISRYFLLKMVYKFNNNKTREEDAKMGWH